MKNPLSQILLGFVQIAFVIILLVLTNNYIALIIAIITFFVADSFFIALITYFLSIFLVRRFSQFLYARQPLEDTPFFNVLFVLLGALAKADGHVSKAEIQSVERIFTKLNLNADQKQHAIDLFNQGKASDFLIDDFIQIHVKKIKFFKIRFLLFETLYITALSDGKISSPEKILLEKVASAINIPSQFIESLARQFDMAGHSEDSLESCYKILGLDPSCSQLALKKAYRKLMRENHPDVMLSKGLPKEMIDLATEKSAEINKAYHRIIKEKYS